MMATNSLAQRILPKSIQDGIARTVEPFLWQRANKEGKCSRKTRDERLSFYPLMVAQLWQGGFRIKKLESLADKHITYLMERWFSEKIANGNLHTRLSHVNVLLRWLGKDDLVRNIKSYLPGEDVTRHTVAQSSLSWESRGIDPANVIKYAMQVDERMACMLSLQHYLGLRVKESIEIRPAKSLIDDGTGTFLEVRDGTKGGRVRRVPVDTDKQESIIDWARELAADGSSQRLRWPGLTWKQAQNRYYNLCRKQLRITKAKTGLNSHGLRHGYAERVFEKQTGQPSPVRGGKPEKMDRETYRLANLVTANVLGHDRTDVAPSYYGSHGHKLRGNLVPTPVPVIYNYSLIPAAPIGLSAGVV
jgi:integrase